MQQANSIYDQKELSKFSTKTKSGIDFHKTKPESKRKQTNIKIETNKIYCMDCIEGMKWMEDNSVDSIVTDPPYGLEFMGKNWDKGVPGILFWKEMLRILKPGSFLLSFGGTRTYHRLVCGIEDAGFEIRDCIQWLYGSGFPKSLDVSKSIDKMKGAEREVIGKKKLNPRDKKVYTPNKFEGMQGTETFKANPNMQNITLPSSAEAKQWEGWGTALKPANEPIVVARKPLSEKSVALNVLKWGTGGINIDACRIEGDIGKDRSLGKPRKNSDKYGDANSHINPQSPLGRFPANIILDEEAAKALDEQSGVTESHYGTGKREGKSSEIFKWGGGDNPYGDRGGASRFFYIVKASKSERNAGVFNISQKVNDGRNTPIDNPFQRGETLRKNIHPTVKPVQLMQYLVRLVTPPDGLVLDCFLGSGSTAIAALKEGFKFIGIEKNKEYVEIAKARLKPYLEQTKLKC